MGFVKPTAISCVLLLGLQQSLKVHAQGDITCPAKTDTPGYKSTSRDCLDEGCTANDVRVGKLSDPTTTDTCTSLSDTITFTSDLEMEVTVGPGRYDLGLYIGTVGTCEVFTFGCDLAEGGADDGDGCGDMLGTSGPNGGLNFYTDIEFTVDCNIQGGELPFPYCTVWDNNVNTVCVGPETVEPGTTSKCKCAEAEVSVPLCLVFIEQALFEIGLPETCPPLGEDIVVTIPGGAIVGTVDEGADFVITVEDSDGNALVEQSYGSGSGDLELTLPNVGGDLTLSVANPSFGGCEAETTFSIDCFFCGSYDCGEGLVSDPDKSETPCVGNVCDDTQCCEEVNLCSSFECGDQVLINDGVACIDNVCDAAQCCEDVELCASFECGDLVLINDGVGCIDNVCDAAQCCEDAVVCASFECGDQVLINDGVACVDNICDAAQCCEDGTPVPTPSPTPRLRATPVPTPAPVMDFSYTYSYIETVDTGMLDLETLDEDVEERNVDTFDDDEGYSPWFELEY